MRYPIILILCAASVCLAQESYHNDEFGFTIDIPSGWYAISEDEWSDKVDTTLKKIYLTKSLLLLSPSDIEPLKSPCIIFQGVKLKRLTTSEAITNLKRNGEKILTKGARYSAKYALGKKIKQYREIDTFYDYDSSRKLAIAKVLYQHKESGTYSLFTVADFIGRRRRVSFDGYWKGDDPESFWQTFNEVVNSFEFDHDSAPKGSISEPITLRRVMKWGSIILTVSIILGFVKMLSRRYF